MCLLAETQHLRWEIFWESGVEPAGYQQGALSDVGVYASSSDDFLGICWPATGECGLYLGPFNSPNVEHLGGWIMTAFCDVTCREDKFEEAHREYAVRMSRVRSTPVEPANRASERMIPQQRIKVDPLVPSVKFTFSTKVTWENLDLSLRGADADESFPDPDGFASLRTAVVESPVVVVERCGGSSYAMVPPVEEGHRLAFVYYSLGGECGDTAVLFGRPGGYWARSLYINRPEEIASIGRIMQTVAAERILLN